MSLKNTVVRTSSNLLLGEGNLGLYISRTVDIEEQVSQIINPDKERDLLISLSAEFFTEYLFPFEFKRSIQSCFRDYN